MPGERSPRRSTPSPAADGLTGPTSSGRCVRVRVRVGAQEPRRRRSRRPLYVVAEKILGAASRCPPTGRSTARPATTSSTRSTACSSTPTSARPFTAPTQRFIGDRTTFAELVYQQEAADHAGLAGQRAQRARPPARPPLASRTAARATSRCNSLRHALREIIACFPVYRTYITDERRQRPRPRATSRWPSAAAKRRNPRSSRSIFDFIRDMLLLTRPEPSTRTTGAEQRRVRRQVPAADRAGHGQGRRGHGLLHLQPPGVAERGRRRPDRFGVSPAAFHRATASAQARWPHALLRHLHARHQARARTCAPDQRAVGDAARSGDAACGAGAG